MQGKKKIESTAMAEAEKVLDAGGGQRTRREHGAKPELVVAHAGPAQKVDLFAEGKVAGLAEGRRESTARAEELRQDLAAHVTLLQEARAERDVLSGQLAEMRRDASGTQKVLEDLRAELKVGVDHVARLSAENAQLRSARTPTVFELLGRCNL